MPTHAERRKLPYTPEQLFDLVADIDSYSEFLPWCAASRVRKREGDVLHADLVIGFKMFREKYTSKVTLQHPNRVDVEYLQGPFKYLNNHWVFEPAEDGGTWLDFYVDFEFKSSILQKMIGMVFNEAVKLMVGAFETRAHQVYGEPNS
ncbi:type II toxin-antitoxin system RatA family toxin [Thalassospira sp.]|uniref:type II toxin-antitoxin system RatA family toxin n=1 Tax=Thalassospira sp. TaxID=1912094 RepID=UPI0027374775|nr:type II toxin-antitoxin system RatA family toxin [Thalassospira sp.]MDP2697812.1 type II toxin-antitoxin system RatA family toxin [Thalassospira sp.]